MSLPRGDPRLRSQRQIQTRLSVVGNLFQVAGRLRIKADCPEMDRLAWHFADQACSVIIAHQQALSCLHC